MELLETLIRLVALVLFVISVIGLITTDDLKWGFWAILMFLIVTY